MINAMNSSGNDLLYITYTSAEPDSSGPIPGAGEVPKKMADLVNPRIFDYLRTVEQPSHVGTVVMDFLDKALAEVIFSRNAAVFEQYPTIQRSGTCSGKYEILDGGCVENWNRCKDGYKLSTWWNDFDCNCHCCNIDMPGTEYCGITNK